MSKDSDKPHAMQPEDTAELRELYRGFEENHLNPLWTQTANLMPPHPKPEAVAHIWGQEIFLALWWKTASRYVATVPACSWRTTRRCWVASTASQDCWSSGA
mgnify:CR=1 FL=1